MEADKTHQVSAFLACRSLADLRRLGEVDSPALSFITLACKHNRTDLLKLLLNHEASSPSDGAVAGVPRCCPVQQEDESHNAVYYAIRSSNVELLRTLLGSVTPELSEQLVSEAYEGLLLNNVFMSEEMHMFVQYKLLDVRFFSKGDEAPPGTSSANIQERIQLLLENIAHINTYLEVDSHFLYTAKFIAQNIHILKQQLKSTYNILPWEEMEFCLVSFVSAHLRRHELNVFYLSIVRKERLLKELDKFASDLQELEEHIRSTTDLRRLRKSVASTREEVAAAISSKYPHLYADYKELRDVSSLYIMETYLDAALLADSATRIGQLTIKRALQVTGEHLKNTLDSPKLSPAVSELLLLSAPKETRKVLLDLRNCLSHPHLELDDSVLYSNIQNDIKKIASVITDITKSNKAEKIKCMLTALVDTNSVEEFKEIANIFQNVYLMNEKKIVPKDPLGIEVLIRDLLRKIKDQTPYEKKLFADVKDILHKIKWQSYLSSADYICLNLIALSIPLYANSKYINNMTRDLKQIANKVLENNPTQKNSLDLDEYLVHLGSLLSKLFISVSTRITAEVADEIMFVIARFNYGRSNGNINCIDEFSRQILMDNSNKNANGVKKRNLKISSDIIVEQISLKLTELGNSIGTDRMFGQLYEHLSSLWKDETANRFMFEALVLDIMTLLDSSMGVPNNMLYLDGDMPLLSGKCLRNHLAHGNALVDILPTDAWSAVLLNAVKLSESKDLLLNCKIGSIVKHDIKQLKQRYELGLSILDKQKEMWMSLLDGNFENLALGIAGGADICSRKNDLSSTLHYAARGPSVEIIKFLTKQKNISIESKDINGQTALHIAATFGRDDTVKFLVANMRNAINEVDVSGKTPLHLASQNGHKITVKILLSLGAKNTITDMLGYSPLRYAVMNNYVHVVKTLLENDVSVDVITGNSSFLHNAAEFGHIEIVKYLLLNDADVNAKNNMQGASPLYLAALNGHLEVVNTLLEKGAHVNFRDSVGRSSLYLAVENSHEEIVRILLEKGAFVNNIEVAYKTAPIHTAAYKGNAFIIGLLLKYKANVNALRNDGFTPLLFAAKGGHADVVDLLLQNRARPDSRDIDGETALHIAALHGRTSVVEILIQGAIDINTQNTCQATPLHIAAQTGHRQMVDTLLAAGANVHYMDIAGCTALHHGAANGHDSISEALLKKGAKVNCRNNLNLTPLHLAAAKSCNEKTIRMLLKYEAGVDEKGKLGQTALHIAAFTGDSPMVQAILQGMADIHADDNSGATALHLAASGNHKAAVEILLKYGADVNCLDAEGSSALCCAAKNNNKDLLGILIAKGADVNVGGGKLLLSAITAGHRHIVEALLKNKNVDINITQLKGSNLLCLAAVSGDGLIARALINRGVKGVDSIQNPSPLSIAISFGHTEFVKVLLENGTNVNPVDPDFSPLFVAVHKNKPDIMEILLHCGAKSNIRDSMNRTPLELAVGFAQMSNTLLLLQQADVRINERGNYNWTLLHLAAQAGNLDLTRLLVDRGADIDALDIDGYKPIHIATASGHNNILAFFLELGMNIDELDSNGGTLMHFAATGGHLAVAQYLIDKHVEINSTSLNGSTPLHCSAREGHTEMAKFLLYNGAVYDATDVLGRTPSYLAESPDIKEVLESIGKLFKAVKRNDVSLICTLVKYLAKYVSVKSSDNATLLHVASWKGFQEACDILLKNKANPNVIGKGGNAPLHYASKYSHPGIVESLLKSGAVHNLKASNMKTPLDFATQKYIKYLLQKIALCFRKVQIRDVRLVKDITKIRNAEIVKAVMKARDTDGNTLVVVAMKKGFPDTDELKQVSQPNVHYDLMKVELMFMQERFADALEILKQVLGKRIEILGEDNPGTLDIQYKIVTALYKQSKYYEVMPMLEDIYKKRVKAFGPYNPDSLETRSTIALLLHRMGRNEESWDIFQEVMMRQQEVLGERHEQIIRTKTEAGLTLHNLGKHEEALCLYRQVLKTHKMTLDADYPNSLPLFNNIALALLAQNKPHEAFAMFQSVYETRKIVLGPNHSDTLRARRNMALALVDQHNSDEALQVCQEILSIQKNVLGLNHVDTLYTQSLLTKIYFSQNNMLDALKVHKAGSKARNAIFGLNHPHFSEMDGVLDVVDKYVNSQLGLDFGCIPDICDLNFLKAVSEGDRGEVCSLIENGSDVNTTDVEGRTALHFATTVEVVELLLDSGADATSVSKKGNTPLHLATSRSCEQTVHLLLQNVKRSKPKSYFPKFINAKTVVGGSTALHVAAKKGATDIVRCLLDNGACYNIRDRSSNLTPLQCSTSLSVTRLLRLAEKVFEMARRGGTMLPQGDERHLAAVVNSRDTEHRTPMQLAVANGHTVTARLLAGLLKTVG